MIPSPHSPRTPQMFHNCSAIRWVTVERYCFDGILPVGAVREKGRGYLLSRAGAWTTGAADNDGNPRGLELAALTMF